MSAIPVDGADLAIKAMQSGVSVMRDKLGCTALDQLEQIWACVAATLADIDRIKAAAIKAKHHVFPVFQYRWGPSLARLRHLMAKAVAGLLSDTIDFADGAGSVELVTATYNAVRSGARVALPISIDHPLYEGWLP